MSHIYRILEELKITYKKHEHPAVYTVEDAQKYDIRIDAGKSKNIFLRNKKGNKYYLVIVESSKRIDLKELESNLHEKRMGFASPERLMEFLGLTPGSVSPFGLINDEKKEVSVVVDDGLLKYKQVAFHPNINTATLVISTDEFKRFLEWTGNQLTYLKL